MHLPKTAGVSLLRAMEDEYGEHAVLHVYGDVESELAALRAMPRAELEVLRAVAGHMPYGAHELVAGPSAYVTILRHPLERTVSHYHWAARHPESPLGAEIRDRGLDLHGYVERSRSAAWFNNGQVRLLGAPAADSAPPADRGTLARALDRLGRFAVVGTTERFDEAVAAVAARFGWSSAASHRENVGPPRAPAGELPDATRELILERNRLDLELYENVAG